MQVELQFRELPRKRPLTISRGTYATSRNLFVTVLHKGIEGYGELAPIGYGENQNADIASSQIAGIRATLEHLSPHQITEIEIAASEIASSARSAIVCACYDWLGKKANMPVSDLLGIPSKCPMTSITIGIMPHEKARELAPMLLQETGTQFVKLKLGSSEGIESDKERYEAVKEVCPDNTRIRVDANGGWSVADAETMLKWLAEKECDYVEQPLGFGNEDALEHLMKVRTIPIFLDEFIATSKDVPKFAQKCDGVNVKLLKSGGIAEAIRIVHTARAHGLMTMIGCFGETSIGIAAGVAIGSLFDYIDLDSHLNMQEDPAVGIELVDGAPRLSGKPGLGVSFR